MRHIFFIILSSILFIGCRPQAEPQSVAGYIADCNEEMILIKTDSTAMRIERSDETIFDERGLIVGNIVEAIYLPTKEEDDLPLALEIFTDETYPKALGHWQSRQNTPLEIDIRLLSHGRIIQSSPQTTLQFTRWQISGKENHIKLYGTLSLPTEPESKSSKDEAKEQKKTPTEPTPAPRRTTHFEVEAELTTVDDAKTESHRVMIIHTDKGRRSTLYFTEE